MHTPLSPTWRTSVQDAHGHQQRSLQRFEQQQQQLQQQQQQQHQQQPDARQQQGAEGPHDAPASNAQHGDDAGNDKTLRPSSPSVEARPDRSVSNPVRASSGAYTSGLAGVGEAAEFWARSQRSASDGARALRGGAVDTTAAGGGLQHWSQQALQMVREHQSNAGRASPQLRTGGTGPLDSVDTRDEPLEHSRSSTGHTSSTSSTNSGRPEGVASTDASSTTYASPSLPSTAQPGSAEHQRSLEEKAQAYDVQRQHAALQQENAYTASEEEYLRQRSLLATLDPRYAPASSPSTATRPNDPSYGYRDEAWSNAPAPLAMSPLAPTQGGPWGGVPAYGDYNSSFPSLSGAVPHSAPFQPQLQHVSSGTQRPLSGVAAAAAGQEFSIFVGDLSPDLREEDLVTQFLHPPAWPASHPISIALAHAQQAQGNYNTPPRMAPAPFLSTRSAKIMADPLTGISRGFGFVRFSLEDDCKRALVEMQGVVITPSTGVSPGRPLRVCTATPKTRGSTSPTASNTALLSDLQLGEGAAAMYGSSSAGGYPSSYGARPDDTYDSFRRGSLPGVDAAGISPSSKFGAGSFAMPHLPSHGAASPPPSNAAPQSGHSATDPNNTTVFVGGLSSLISEETLKTFFIPFGEITYTKIPPGKGCGFVQFVYKADAERALERMQGFPIGGGRIRLSWGRSQGDKAAAAAASAAAQAAHLGQLANLAGLSGLTPQQLAQLAGLSSALKAAQSPRSPPAPQHAEAAAPPLDVLRHLANTSSAYGQQRAPEPEPYCNRSPAPMVLADGSYAASAGRSHAQTFGRGGSPFDVSHAGQHYEQANYGAAPSLQGLGIGSVPGYSYGDRVQSARQQSTDTQSELQQLLSKLDLDGSDQAVARQLREFASSHSSGGSSGANSSQDHRSGQGPPFTPTQAPYSSLPQHLQHLSPHLHTPLDRSSHAAQTWVSPFSPFSPAASPRFDPAVKAAEQRSAQQDQQQQRHDQERTATPQHGAGH